MGTFTFSYDNAEVAALLEGFRITFNYQETIPNPENPVEMIPNPETLPQFAKRKLKEKLRGLHATGVVSLADVDSAKQAALADAEARSEAFDVT